MRTPADFIRRIDPDARQLWSAPTSAGVVTCYQVGDGTLLLLEYAGSNGVEVFVPATLKNSISETVTAARDALNVDQQIAGETVGLAI